ncbi:MAG: DUF6152 family protein [Gammaproteobacteria bacterium]
MTRFIVVALPFLSSALTSDALAHHSRAAVYDMSTTVEVAGEVTRVLWRNPHIRFWLDVEMDGEVVEWEVESTPPGTLERHGISQEILRVGQTLRIAGPPGRYNVHSMEASNLLLPDGREVLIMRDSVPRWSDQTLGWAPADPGNARVEAAVSRADGIYRVWSRDEDASFRVREGSSFRLVGLTELPLTQSAREYQENFDPIADNPIPGCTPKGMPYIMGQPYPIEFVDEGNRILLRIEEYDLTRVIHMTENSALEPESSLGYSRGHWEGDSLVVLTSAILDPHYQAGIPLSDSVEVEERFDLSDDGTRLDHRLTVTDPGTFTAPVTRERYWTWIPGIQIMPYECTDDA